MIVEFNVRNDVKCELNMLFPNSEPTETKEVKILQSFIYFQQGQTPELAQTTTLET